jgi:hypothetical protein
LAVVAEAHTEISLEAVADLVASEAEASEAAVPAEVGKSGSSGFGNSGSSGFGNSSNF